VGWPPYRVAESLIGVAARCWPRLESLHPDTDLAALPLPRLLSIVYIFTWDRWFISEKNKRLSGIKDPALRDSIPDPTEEEFLVLLDPTQLKELDFFNDYVQG
jgi:hypothetical protein